MCFVASNVLAHIQCITAFVAILGTYLTALPVLPSYNRAGGTGLTDPATAGPKLQKPTIQNFSVY